MTTIRSGGLYEAARVAALAALVTGCPSSTGEPPRDAAPDVAADQGAPDVAPDAAQPTADAGPTAGGIGEPCEADGNPFPPRQGTCAAGQICLAGQIGFRNGYCSRACFGSACPAGSVCGRYQNFPICLRLCTSNDACRAEEGYVCAATEGTTMRVCRVNDEPVGTRPDGSACFTTTAGPNMAPALPRRAFPITAERGNLSVSEQRNDSLIEAEGNIAVNSTNGNVSSSYIAINQGSAFMGASHSEDRGMMWSTNGTVTDPMLNSTSDPVLDYGRDGSLRMAFIGIGRDGSGRITNMHVRVARSMDNGGTWTPAVQVEPANFCAAGRLCDKPWILAGPGTTAGSESLYIVYLQQGNGNADLVSQRSDDGGMTWSAPVFVARAMGSFDGTVIVPNLAQLAVGPSGTAGVSWTGLSASQGSIEGNLVRLGSEANRVFFRRSTDGMRTFEATRRVSRPDDSPVYEQPPVALDGSTVHVAYVSGRPTGAWDIILATSTNNGESWQYRKVNDERESCATHAFPAMVVDPMTHDVHLIWMENRFGDGAVAYARCPADAARPCGQNEAVSDRPFRFTTGRNPTTWHGDYLGLAISASGDLWATWSDTRTGRPAMYVQRGRAR